VGVLVREMKKFQWQKTNNPQWTIWDGSLRKVCQRRLWKLL